MQESPHVLFAGPVSKHPFTYLNISSEKSSLTDTIPFWIPYIIVWVCISACFEYLEDIEVPTPRRVSQRKRPEVIMMKSRLVHEPFKDLCLPEFSCSPDIFYCEFNAWSIFSTISHQSIGIFDSTSSTLQHIQVAALDDGFYQDIERSLPKYFVLQSPLEALDGFDKYWHHEGPSEIRLIHRVPKVLVDQPEHATLGGVEPGEDLFFEQVACVKQTIQGVLRGVPRHLRGISRHEIDTLLLGRHLDAIRADGGNGGRASRVSWYCEKAPSKRPSNSQKSCCSSAAAVHTKVGAGTDRGH